MDKNSIQFIFAIMVLCLSCACEKSKNIQGINLSVSLQVSCNNRNIKYEELVKQALKKDKRSIKELALTSLDGEASYDHGEVLLQIIERIGEKSYIESIKGLSIQEKRVLYFSLKAGTEYSSSTSLESRFPELYYFLEENK